VRSLTLVVQFPDRAPIAVGGFGDIASAKENVKTSRRTAWGDEGVAVVGDST